MIEAGEKAPAFTLSNQKGVNVKLSDLKGKSVILYFYPKDDTPGCTTEARGFRDEFQDFKKKNAVILGVSPDGAASHVKFSSKYNLPFDLLVDEDHAVAEKYGAWGEKNLYGKKSMGIIRSTWLIGPDGKVKKVWKKVKADGHWDEVLKALDE